MSVKYTMSVKYFVRRNYGSPRIYLLDALQAEAMESLTGRRTHDLDQMRTLRVLGIEIERVEDPALADEN